MEFYKAASIFAGIYSSENWVIAKSKERRMQSAEMKFLKSAAGYTQGTEKETRTYEQN